MSPLADAAGVVYTLAAGDQPGAICEIAEWAWGLGRPRSFEKTLAPKVSLTYDPLPDIA